jgi:hypothetical protein
LTNGKVVVVFGTGILSGSLAAGEMLDSTSFVSLADHASDHVVCGMKSSTPHKLIPNADVTQTVKAMGQLANSGKKDPDIVDLVSRICQDLAQGDYSSEVLAIYYWVCQNIRYIRDPDDVELLKTPRKILQTKSGDCDDMSILLAAMCMTAGNPVDFCLAGFSPGALSHVYCAVRTPAGHLVLDPVANRSTGSMLKDIKHMQIVRLTVGDGVMDAGIGALPHIGPGGGNLYSVYDYHSGTYDYYEAEHKPIPSTGSQRLSASKSPLGIVPEDIAAALPSGAKKVGNGEEARGMIATDGRKQELASNKSFFLGVVGGLSFAWFWNRRKK